MSTEKTATALLEEQKQRHAALTARRTRAEGQLEAERRALDEAKQEALKLFGTADLEQLRALYAQQSQSNDQTVVEFVMALDEVDQGLTTIERQLGQ
jgi:RNA processing factor Prp31